MGEPLVCVACDKDNHKFCLGRGCECAHCEDQQLREEQTYGGDRRGRDHT